MGLSSQVPPLPPDLRRLGHYLRTRDGGAPDVLPVPLEITQVTVATGLVLDTISWSVPPSQYGLPPDGFLVWWSDGILADPLDGGAKLSASSRRFSMAWPSERDHSYAVAAYRHTWQGEQAGSKQQHETWRVVT